MVGAGWGTLGQSGDQWVGHSESASASPSHKVTFGTVFAILAMLILEEGVLIWDGEQCGWAGSTFDNNAKIHPTPRQSHFVRLGPSSSWTKGFQMDLLNECIAAAHLLCQTITLPFILTPFTQCCWSLPLPLPSSYLRSSWSGSISSWTSSADGADMEGVQLKQVGHLSFLVR